MKSTFDLCTENKLLKDGGLEIHCKLGLWATQGMDHKQVEIDARHYWIQYFKDGEYKKLLDSKP